MASALLRLPACLPACLPRAPTLTKKIIVVRCQRPEACFFVLLFFVSLFRSLFLFCSSRKGDGIDMSERLRRAAEDLKRMQTEYEELQAQAHGELGTRNPSAPSGTTGQSPIDNTSETVGRFSHHTANTSSLHHRPSSFRPGHRNPHHDNTSYFERRRQPSPGFRGGGGERGERRETDGQPIELCSTILPSSSDDETQ